MNTKTIEQAISALNPDIAVLIRGPHGIGKSHLARRLAQSLNLPFIDVRASTMQEGDVVGYPDLEKIKETGVSSFALPSWFMRASREPVVLMLDELNRATPSVMNSFFQVILDRCLGNGPDGLPIYLHKDTRIVSAVNTGSDYAISDMDPALLDRFWVADLTVDSTDWIDWAKQNGINEVIIDFLNNHPEHLREDGEVEPGKVTPSQRSWQRLSDNLQHIELKTESKVNQLVYIIASGFIGVETASAFSSFVEKYNFVLQAEDILNRFESVKKRIPVDNTEQLTILTEKITEHCAKEIWTDKQLKNFKKFFDKLNPELQMFCFVKILGCKIIQNILKVRDLVSTRILEISNETDLKAKS